MTQFLGPDFLLDTPMAKRLYHDVAAPLPIVDFHNHLDPADIQNDRKWDNLGQIWLEGDHYKWRAMRWAGEPENLITGDADYRAKYDAFVRTITQSYGNPLYHWSHLEMFRYFDLEGTVLTPDTADRVWDQANEMLAGDEFGARGLLRQMNVEFVATTDDPCDTLEHHVALASGASPGFITAPSFRPDTAIKIEMPGFADYIARLSKTVGAEITDFDGLMAALEQRLDHFVSLGCRAADHGIDVLRLGAPTPPAQLDVILQKRLDGATLSEDEIARFQTAVLANLGAAYAARDLVMQMHIGASRNNRSATYETLGADVGVDSMGDRPIAAPLNGLLDRIERAGKLPRTILYCLDPTKNEIIITTAGNFQGDGIAGRVQPGTAWWFNDQLDGMERHMTQLSQMGLLFQFLGMLTDSRSFLSFPRHEYFRRLLCQMVGRWAATGAIPDDFAAMETLIRNCCYDNAKRWFCP